MSGNRFRIPPHFLIVLSALLVVSCGDGGDGDGPVAPPPTETIHLRGSLAVADFVDKEAAEPGIWIVAVDASGLPAASQGLDPDAGGEPAFDLAVDAGDDLVLEVRSEGASGPTLATLLLGSGEESRTVFTVPSDAGDVDMGHLTLRPETGWAVSDRSDELAPMLPAPDSDYRDLDEDLVPDAFDRDDDGDGIPDIEDPASDLVRFSMDGGVMMMETVHGTWRTTFWLTGIRDSADRTMTLDISHAPRLDVALDLDIPMLLNGFRIWPDSVPAVFDHADALVAGNLRIGYSGMVRLKVDPDIDGAGTAGYRIHHTGFAPCDGDTCLSCEEFDCIADDPAGADRFVAYAWAGVRATAAMQAVVRELMSAYEWCIENKQDLLDHREFLDEDVVVEGDLFPGDETPGTATYGWRNQDDNAGINPGDSFTAFFDGYWRDRPGSDVDVRLDGRIDIHHYIDLRGDPARVLMGANFVEFRDLTLTPTRAEGGIVTVDAGAAVTMNSYAQDMTPGGPAFWIEF